MKGQIFVLSRQRMETEFPQEMLKMEPEVSISSEVRISGHHCMSQGNLVSTHLCFRRVPLGGFSGV